MGWLSTLYETYQNMSQSGLYEDLLPIAHTTQQAQIEVTVNELGEYVGGIVVPKEEAETVIPCTEESAGRSGSHPVNHPLMDKLQYVAGDYTKYGGEKGDSFYKEYMADLQAWCESLYSSPKLEALYNYLKKGTLISDLVRDRILYCGEDNKLLLRYQDKANAPLIFKVLPGAQSDAFVRFRVIGLEGESGDRTALWKNKKIRQDYINYYLDNRKGNELCYILGKRTSCAVNHPSKLRNPGDMAKLISANDTSGFTFRGRFVKSEEAAGVSYEVSQGAHNALKWLIKHQGNNYGNRVYITWNPRGSETPKIDKDSLDTLLGYSSNIPNTAMEFSREFHKAMSGYRAKLKYYDKVVIMGIDAATTGRMAVTFYREELANELIDNLEYWHTTCAWRHKYRFIDNRPQEFYGAPSPADIALASFGVERTNYLDMDDKLKKNTVERILHCIVDRAAIPNDIVNATYQNVCHPQNYKNRSTWHKVLSIYCALFRKYDYDRSKDNKKEEWIVELNEKEESLAYLCGRLLAVADALEWNTYSEEEKRRGRMTNAMNYFTKFVEHPCQTWKQINNSLKPYMAKLGEKAVFYRKLLSDISARIPQDEFYKAKNLDGRMALGFYSQQSFIYSKKENKANQESGIENQISEKEED